MPEQIINTDNYNPSIELPSGYEGFLPRTSPVGGLEGVGLFCEAFKLMPESEWRDRVAAMEEAKAFARYGYEAQNPKTNNQNGLSFCWSWSLTQCVEAARVNTLAPYEELAPESLGELTGWRNAGFYCDKALQYAIKHGISSRKYVPLHSLNYRGYGQGWREDALHYRPMEYYDLGGENMWAECVTAVLSGFTIYVGYNWWRHAVMLDWLTYVGSELCPSTPNSWGANQRRTLRGKQKVPNEAFAIRTASYYVPRVP